MEDLEEQSINPKDTPKILGLGKDQKGVNSRHRAIETFMSIGIDGLQEETTFDPTLEDVVETLKTITSNLRRLIIFW